ncbi:MAG: hypothetical protein PUB21_08095 [Bacteroidales bacterium]|nr:hypothetical protein [Bacteroidales bacterium]
MKVIDLENIIAGKFGVVHKSVGVLLHDSGFMRYKKLTAENYNYWWYEVSDKSKMNKRNFTYEWSDMEQTRKFHLLKVLLPLHSINENIHTILNNALNLISALHDGTNINSGQYCFKEVFDMYYSGRNKENKQLTLF